MQVKVLFDTSLQVPPFLQGLGSHTCASSHTTPESHSHSKFMLGVEFGGQDSTQFPDMSK